MARRAPNANQAPKPVLSWKSVFILWIFSLPFLAIPGWVAYQHDPRPFKAAWAWSQKTYREGMAIYLAYAKDRAKKKAEADAAAKKAAEEGEF